MNDLVRYENLNSFVGKFIKDIFLSNEISTFTIYTFDLMSLKLNICEEWRNYEENSKFYH